MANVNRDIWVKYDDGACTAVKIKTHFVNGVDRADSLSDVSDLISAFFSNSSPNELGQYALHLPQGVTRETSGLDANCFLGESYKLSPDCTILSLGTLGSALNYPLIIKSSSQGIY
jgi:hypothetical protein